MQIYGWNRDRNVILEELDFATTEKVAKNWIAGGFLVSPFIIRLAWGFHSRQRVVRFGNEMDMICE